ncbi:MAG: diphosphate--fructose-6-phosphate 1-phosphotransferase [Candidatus Omnitrophota bacterium]|jgi:6-phosphofructokinase 1
MKPILKGRAVVGQSGGCTAVINQSLAGVIEGVRGRREITALWGAAYGVNGILGDDYINLKSQSASVLKALGHTPSSALGSSRHKLPAGGEEEVLARLRRHDVRYLFMIGGNDTADTVLRIARAAEKENYELRVVHIPKTIDNDLKETDHTPGYGSVARFAAVTTQEAGLDTRAMKDVDPVKMIELMGRNSGWIVAASALLKKTQEDPPHLLLLPEIPFEEGRFLDRVEAVVRKTGHCVVVLSETIRDAQGNRIGALREGITQDPFGHVYVEGAARYLCRRVEERLKVRARFDKPGTIQRMSMPYVSTVDQREAFLAGVHAVRWALKGVTRVMVGFRRAPGKLYRIDYVPVPLEKIPNRERYLPENFLTSDSLMTTEAFKRYALPLLGPNLPSFPSLKR